VAGLIAPAGVQFVPGEQVLLLAVTLPKMSAAQRRATVAFAVEDQIARPLDEVHVALGPLLSGNRWLVGVIARTALPTLAQSGIRLVPDTLALPVPPEGHWSVFEVSGRVLIRLPDGTGFVTGAQGLAVLHQIAGSPAITLYSGQIAASHVRASLPQVAVPSAFDLSDHRGNSHTVPPLARRLMAIAALAALGHLAILATDTISLSRRQAALEAELRSAAGATPDMAIDALLTRILAPQRSAPKGFLDLISTAFVAAAPQSGQVSVRELRYTAAQNDLTLTVQAADLGTLQLLETSIGSAGLVVQSGAATSAGGTAEQQLTLQGPPT
jgi:general secretion pathway protein L